MKKAVFLIRSNDRKGLLSGISTFFYQQGFNILHCQQYTDNCENLYFMRVCLDITDMPVTRKQLAGSFEEYAKTLNLEYSLHYSDEPQRMAIGFQDFALPLRSADARAGRGRSLPAKSL